MRTPLPTLVKTHATSELSGMRSLQMHMHENREGRCRLFLVGLGGTVTAGPIQHALQADGLGRNPTLVTTSGIGLVEGSWRGALQSESDSATV